MQRVRALDALEVVIRKKWEDANSAFERTKAGANSDEVRQESKYDTRGLEESYLAHGLANAAEGYLEALGDLNACRTAAITETISLGSLIHCRNGGGSIYFLLSRSGGGIEAVLDGEEVTIITPESPLAKKLMGKKKGEHLATPPFTISSVS